MEVNELKDLADNFVEVTATKKGLESELKKMKEDIVSELEKVDDTKFNFLNGLKAAKQDRKGTVDIKAIQIKYNISDAELDAFRKPSTFSWVLTVR